MIFSFSPNQISSKATLKDSNCMIKQFWNERNRSFHPFSFAEFCQPKVPQDQDLDVPILSHLPEMSYQQETTMHLHHWERFCPILSRLTNTKAHDMQKEIFMAQEGSHAKRIFQIWSKSFQQRPSGQLLYEGLREQLESSKSFGYPISHVPHMLQTATLLEQAGASARIIALGMIHDMAFIADNKSHDSVIADLLNPFLSEGEYFLLSKHALIQSDICIEFQGPHDRRHQLESSPYYEATCKFVYYYDSIANSHLIKTKSLEELKPYLESLFDKI